MKPLPTLLLVVALLLVPTPARATYAADTVTLDGVTVRVRPGTAT